MQSSDERAGDEHEAGDPASARPEPEHVAHQKAFEANRRVVRRPQEQLCELAANVAATQERLAASLCALAERAAREGRADDAMRLASRWNGERSPRFGSNTRSEALGRTLAIPPVDTRLGLRAPVAEPAGK